MKESSKFLKFHKNQIYSLEACKSMYSLRTSRYIYYTCALDKYNKIGCVDGDRSYL